MTVYILSIRWQTLTQKQCIFSIGAHEAYACDGGIENYSLVFDTCESFETLLLNDGFLNHKVQKITDDSCELPLKYSYMEFDTLIFSNLKSKTVKLKTILQAIR